MDLPLTLLIFLSGAVSVWFVTRDKESVLMNFGLNILAVLADQVIPFQFVILGYVFANHFIVFKENFAQTGKWLLLEVGIMTVGLFLFETVGVV